MYITKNTTHKHTFLLLILCITVLIFCVVLSRQEEKSKTKKKGEPEDAPRVIILDGNADESKLLDDIPEDLREKVKEALGKAKFAFQPHSDSIRGSTPKEPNEVKNLEDLRDFPAYPVREDFVQISLDEVTRPADYSTFVEDDDNLETKSKEKKQLVFRRKLMSQRIDAILRKKNNEKLDETDFTPKLLEARSLLDPDLEEYPIEHVEQAIGIYESVLRENPDNALAMYNLGTIYKVCFQRIILTCFQTDKFGKREFSKSKRYFILAALLGHAASQFETALLYSNNLVREEDLASVKQMMIDLFGAVENMPRKIKVLFGSISDKVENSEIQSLTNLIYSSLGGTTAAHIALGYRHLYGHGVPKSCKTAAHYYSMAADDLVEEFSDGKIPVVEHVRLNDETAIQNKQSQDDVMEYYQYSASKGSSSSKLIVGYAMMYGLRGFEQNGDMARRLFEQAAEAGEYEAYGALGNMYLKGVEGITRNNETAYKYFKKGAEKKDPGSLNGLGKMFLEGATNEEGKYILEPDYVMAANFFNKSAAAGSSEGQYNLGMLYFEGKGVKKSFKQALQLLTGAAQHGQILGRYQLAKMYLYGLGTSKNCDVAIKFYKSVVEKASWTSIMDIAFDKYVSGEDQHTALVLYEQAAELGIEIAQANVAFMYDRGYGVEEIVKDLSQDESQSMKFRGALKWYKHAAEQGNVDAYVKVGDYYYYGSSALSSSISSVESMEQSYEKSVYFYRRAKELNNAQAMFNLGYMHEHGIGLPQDFHLAKRYYDMSADSDQAAYVPVILALGKLYAHWGLALGKQYVNRIFYGEEPTLSEDTENLANLDDGEESNDFSGVLVDFVMFYEDYLLAILIGGLTLLLFVRYIVANQAQFQNRRLARVDPQAIINNNHD